MEEMTISQVSKNLGISTRMLRYYEQTDLIKSFRREGYAYRIYDETAILKIKQIILLRKLRISVRQIKVILENPDAVTAIEIFRQNISELDEEITAISTIRNILGHFVTELSKTTELPINIMLARDDALLASIESLSLISINFKEEQTMAKLKRANESLSKIRDVRFIYIPPCAVAAAHYIGDEPEMNANKLLDDYVREKSLHKLKPDLRRFGFNHPNPTDDTGWHGYEAWVTIPDEMVIAAPLVKKKFSGGLYAAHMISFGDFNEWDAFLEYIMENKKYEFAGDMQDQEHMCGLLEEHLNYYSHIEQSGTNLEELQLDLLMPVRVKVNDKYEITR